MVTDSRPEIDPSQTVYPVRGSYTWYQCVIVGKILGDPGKNCAKYDVRTAAGIAYKDAFGDWHVKMVGGHDSDRTRYPPPTGY